MIVRTVRTVRVVRVVRVVRIVLVVLMAGAVVSAAQFQRALSFGERLAGEKDFDGRFNFCRLVYDGKRFPYLEPTPAVRDWCILVDGLARAFRGAGGLRVGWACGPRDVIEAAATAQEHGSGPPGRVVQRVALSALQSPYDIGLLAELEASRDFLLEAVEQLPGVRPWPVPATTLAVRNTTGISRSRSSARIRASTVGPSTVGIMTSRRIASGRTRRASAIPPAPSAAVCTS